MKTTVNILLLLLIVFGSNYFVFNAAWDIANAERTIADSYKESCAVVPPKQKKNSTYKFMHI